MSKKDDKTIFMKKCKVTLEKLHAEPDDKFGCLKPNDQNIWEAGYVGQVLNKFANFISCYVYLSPYVVLNISISLSLPLSLHGSIHIYIYI